ncbi:hypothetical protein EK21DRAFT_111105 [Setomelanomma holmii]|uniref:Uncharacterized protein n=1 Tax=Setomelanomma holmii TaxID=210430 RepID=A0A9P4HCV3_9PLEO|nr:hypothetical protein EK21DRAFT_111105 [Setomelanomma holmii]
MRLLPALKEHDERIALADQLTQSLKRVESENADVKAVNAKHAEELIELRKRDQDRETTDRKDREEKEKWFNQKLAELVERQVAEDVNHIFRRPEAKPKVVPCLFREMASLGVRAEKARQDMSNTVRGKNRGEQAFVKWKNTYCKPVLELVLLTEKVKTDQDIRNGHIAEQLADLVRREEIVKLREDFEAGNRRTMMRKLEQDRSEYEEERDEWRLAQAQKLNGREFRVVRRIWEEGEGRKLKEQIWEEARSEGYVAAQQDMNLQNAANCEAARQEGDTNGYADGVQDGKEYGYTNIMADLEAILEGARAEGYQEADVTKAEAVAESYEQGHAAGLDVGKLEGRAEGLEEGLATGKREGRAEALKEPKIKCEEAFHRAFHWGVRLPLWAAGQPRDIFERDRTAFENHSYWWGRHAGHFIRTQGLLRDRHSQWYGADKDNHHDLSLIMLPSGWDRQRPYYCGIWDGLLMPGAGTIPLPDWVPPREHFFREPDRN